MHFIFILKPFKKILNIPTERLLIGVSKVIFILKNILTRFGKSDSEQLRAEKSKPKVLTSIIPKRWHCYLSNNLKLIIEGKIF
jgi:hypothetical protein